MIDKLVSFGANVNVKDNKGNTALHHAYWLLDETMCGFVLKHQGNSLTEKNNDGESPLDILLLQAKENPANQKKVQDIIRQMVDSVDFKADQQNDKNSIFRLLKFAEEINDKELFHLLLEKAELTAEAFNQEKLDTENSGKPEEPVLPSAQEFFVSNAKPLSSESTKEVHTTDIEPGIIASESSTPPSTDSVKDTSLSSESINNTSPEPEVVVSEQSTPPSSREELDKLIIKATKEVSEFHALLNSNHNNYLHQAPVLALGENLCEITELLNSPTNKLDDEAPWVSFAISALEQCFDGFNSDVQKIDTTPVVKNIFERFVDKLLGLFGFTNKKEQQKQEQVNFFAQNNPAIVLREELASIKKSIAGKSTGKEAQCASVRFGDELAKIKAQADEKTGNELGQEPGQEPEQTQILKRS